MSQETFVQQLVADMRTAHAADPETADRAVEALLQARLADRPASEGREILLQALDMLSPRTPRHNAQTDQDVLTRVCALLLGRKVTPEDLTSTQMVERLAESLNTIFNVLNKLIGVINMTLSGGASQGDQTIRQFIGFHLEKEDQVQSLEAYLGRINEAFLTTQEAFKAAASTKVAQILNALDAESIAADRKGGLKIGPMRKAEDYDILRERIDRIQRWFNSGRFMEDYLREFEKSCQKFNRT